MCFPVTPLLLSHDVKTTYPFAHHVYLHAPHLVGDNVDALVVLHCFISLYQGIHWMQKRSCPSLI